MRLAIQSVIRLTNSAHIWHRMAVRGRGRGRQTISWWQGLLIEEDDESIAFPLRKLISYEHWNQWKPVVTKNWKIWKLCKSQLKLKTSSSFCHRYCMKEWEDSGVTSGTGNHTLAKKWQLKRSVGSILTFGTSSVAQLAHTWSWTKTASAQPSAHRRRCGTAYSSQGVSSLRWLRSRLRSHYLSQDCCPNDGILIIGSGNKAPCSYAHMLIC